MSAPLCVRCTSHDRRACEGVRQFATITASCSCGCHFAPQVGGAVVPVSDAEADRDAQRTRAEAAEAEVARLRAALAAVLPFQNCNGHAHARDGIWDPDNSGGRACRPCVKCHAFADARDAIGRPRWPSPQSVDGHEAGDHAEGCGCGGARR